MCNLVDKEPTCFEEATKQKEWVNSMVNKYQSIKSNDVWEIVPRPKDKSVVSSKWIYKTKHLGDGSIEKYKAMFVACRFPRRNESSMRRPLHQWLDTPQLETFLPWHPI